MQSRHRGPRIARSGLSLGLAVGAGLLWIAGCASSPEPEPTEAMAEMSGPKADSMAATPIRIDGDYAPDMPLQHVLWRRAASGGAVVADAFMQDGVIFIVTEHHWVYAMDRQGRHLWAEELGLRPSWRPAMNDDVVCFISDADLIMLTRAHGQRLFRKRLSFTPAGPPAASDTAVYVPSWDGNRIYSVDTADGTEGWRYRFGGAIEGAPVVVGEAPRQTLVAASEAGEVVALEALPYDSVPGEPLWKSNTLGPNRANLASDGDQLVLVASEDASLYAFDRITGHRRWAFASGHRLTAAPVVSGEAVFQPTPEGVVAVTLERGHKMWRHHDSDRFLTRDGNKVLVLDSGSRTVCTLEADSGAVLATHDLGMFSFFFTNTEDDGRMYVATATGELIALDGQALTQ